VVNPGGGRDFAFRQRPTEPKPPSAACRAYGPSDWTLPLPCAYGKRASFGLFSCKEKGQSKKTAIMPPTGIKATAPPSAELGNLDVAEIIRKIASIIKRGHITSSLINIGTSIEIGRKARITTAKHASTINRAIIHAKLFPTEISFSQTVATSKDFIVLHFILFRKAFIPTKEVITVGINKNIKTVKYTASNAPSATALGSWGIVAKSGIAIGINKSKIILLDLEVVFQFFFTDFYDHFIHNSPPLR